MVDSAAHAALEAQDNAALAAALCQKDIDLAATNTQGHSLVMAAVVMGRQTSLRLLLNARASPDFSGYTTQAAAPAAPAPAATKPPHLKRDSSSWSAQDQRTPLLYAAHAGDVACLSLLLDAGAEANACDDNARTPTLIAARAGHIACIEVLLRSGASVNQPNAQNMTPLFRAAEQGHVETMRLLIRGKADVDMADDQRRTPAFVCAQLDNDKCLEALIQDADPNLRLPNVNGRTPLMIARATRNFASAAVLSLATLEHDLVSDHLVMTRESALTRRPRRVPLDGLTSDHRELRSIVTGDTFITTLPYAFVRKPLATSHAVVRLVKALRDQEARVTAFDERGGEQLLEAAFRVQVVLIAMLDTLDDGEFCLLMLPPEDTTALLDAAVAAGCKMLLAYPRIQRLLQDRWTIVGPRTIRTYASRQYWGEGEGGEEEGSLAQRRMSQHRTSQAIRARAETERRVAERSSYQALLRRLALALMRNLALLVAEALWPPLGPKIEGMIASEKRAASERVAARNSEPKVFDGNGFKAFYLDGVLLSTAIRKRSEADQQAKRDRWARRRAAVMQDEADLVEFDWPLFQPFGTFILHVTSKVCFVALLTTLPPIGDESFGWLGFLLVWAVQALVVQVHSLLEKPMLWLSEVFNTLDLGSLLLVCIGLGWRFAVEAPIHDTLGAGATADADASMASPTPHTWFDTSQEPMVRHAQALLAIGIGVQSLTLWCKILETSSTFGPLVLMALEMVRDCALFLTLLSGVFFGFAVVLVTLMLPIEVAKKAGAGEGTAGGGAATLHVGHHLPVQQGYGSAQEAYATCGPLFGDTFEGIENRAAAMWQVATALLRLVLGSDQTLMECLGGHAMTPLVLDAFNAIVIVMALNMLIAQMSTTYERIRERLATNYMFLTALVIVTTMNKAHVPPPLTIIGLPYHFARLAVHVFAKFALRAWPTLRPTFEAFGYQPLGNDAGAAAAATYDYDVEDLLRSEDALRASVLAYMEQSTDGSEMDERWKARQTRQLGAASKGLADLESRLVRMERNQEVLEQSRAIADMKNVEALKAELAAQRRLLEILVADTLEARELEGMHGK